jgi:drug/metabolite transporter (DMT)-like permease
MPSSRLWLVYALVTTISWGIWGAFIEIPEKAGFPATLGYSVWAITMIPCALIALYNINWKLERDTRSVLLGCVVGLTGSGGQLLLFQALRGGPAYIVFPLVSMFPIVSIFLSVVFLKERATKRQWTGIAVALAAIFCLSYQQSTQSGSTGYGWLILSVFVFILWGIQAYAMKFSNTVMKAESIFFYMTVTAMLLIPVAIAMTDFSHPVNLGFRGPYLAAMIHILNAIGALTLVYALRYGKAMIVVPVTGLSPLITIVISLLLYRVIPGAVMTAGMVFAALGLYLLSE